MSDEKERQREELENIELGEKEKQQLIDEFIREHGKESQ
jgi:hypothetical protein